MFYDLHMHSCLSPCADNDMTPNNMLNMGVIKGLDLMALTDHNTTANLASFAKVAEMLPVEFVCGCELQTSEEVHVVALFRELEEALAFQPWIDAHMPIMKNDPQFFGDQRLVNEVDEVAHCKDELLLVSLDTSVEETIAGIHEHNGKAILAHVCDKANSINSQLGFIPPDLEYDGLEVMSMAERVEISEKQPWLSMRKTQWFIDSDAHQLWKISEPENSITEEEWQAFWGEAL